MVTSVQKKLLFLFFVFLALTVLAVILHRPILRKINAMQTASATPPPPPKIILVDNKPKVIYPQDFNIVMVGDSMTDALGNSDEIRANLKKHYTGKSFEVLNYGFGSTNILSVEDRLLKTTFFHRDFRPITEIDFNLILIESFGNNPLAQFPLDEGLKKQTEALDKIVEIIKKSNPQAVIAFVSTIAPHKESYGLGQVDLTTEKRVEWANLRIAYIKNHMDYARSHNIPLIDIFDASVDKNGDGNTNYFTKTDHIHPSPNGIIFISQIIADEIFKQQLLKSH